MKKSQRLNRVLHLTLRFVRQQVKKPFLKAGVTGHQLNSLRLRSAIGAWKREFLFRDEIILAVG